MNKKDVNRRCDESLTRWHEKNDEQDAEAYWKITDRIEKRSRARAKKAVWADSHFPGIPWYVEALNKRLRVKYEAEYKKTYEKMMADAEFELAKFRAGRERHNRRVDEIHARWLEEMKEFESQQKTRRHRMARTR